MTCNQTVTALGAWLQIPGKDHSVWIDGPDETEARPSAAIKGTQENPTDLHQLDEVGELEDYHEVKALRAHSVT